MVSCRRFEPFAWMAKSSLLRSRFPPVRLAVVPKTIRSPSSLIEIPYQLAVVVAVVSCFKPVPSKLTTKSW